MSERGHVQLPRVIALPKGTWLFVDKLEAGRHSLLGRNGEYVKTRNAVGLRQNIFEVVDGRQYYRVDRLSCSIASDHPMLAGKMGTLAVGASGVTPAPVAARL